MSRSSAIRKSDRKAGQILGVTVTRGHVDVPKKQPSVVESLKNRFRLGRCTSDGPSSGAGDALNAPHSSAPPHSNPELVRLPALNQTEIGRMRHLGSIGYDHAVGCEDDNNGDLDGEGDTADPEECTRIWQRSAQRSRAKALAILGPEASRVFSHPIIDPSEI